MIETEDIEFEWSDEKNRKNQEKHGVSFEDAVLAFYDQNRIIAHDSMHSQKEKRWFCIGKVEDEILTVRFTHRKNKTRIIGAGSWRKWRKYYEDRRQAH